MYGSTMGTVLNTAQDSLSSKPEHSADHASADDASWMTLALRAAEQSAADGEVPVGAVLVRRDASGRAQLLAHTHNQPIGLHDPTAHAELLALRQAAQQLGNYRLDDCELYVTLEPCAMCAQAILHARLKRVVFGAAEPKTGAAGSVVDLFAMPQLNHQTQVVAGVMAESCAALLRDFFRDKRVANKRASTPLREDALRCPDVRYAPVWEAWPAWETCSHFSQAITGLDQLRLHWMDLGSARSQSVWVGLHSPAAWWPELLPWAKQRLALGDRVLLPDLIGFGQSDKPKKAQWHSLERHADILWHWLGSLGLRQVHLAEGPGQRQLANLLQQQQPDRVAVRESVSADLACGLRPEWRDLPYPDAGHRAGFKAWRAAAWDIDPGPGQ